MKKPKIGICHYRIGGTDGTSIEIDKRRPILEDMGYDVRLIGGYKHNSADYVIHELEYNRPDIVMIKENAFHKLREYHTDKEIENDIYYIARKIEEKFLTIHEKEKFDYIFVHNIFSHGLHLPASKAFFDIFKQTQNRWVSFNHDFYFSYPGDLYKPSRKFIKEFVRKYLPPPNDPRLKHVVINTIKQAEMLKEKKIKAMVFPDTFTFDESEWDRDKYNSTFLKDSCIKENDLIVIQATRLIRRKAIELSIDFVAGLQEQKNKLIGKTLYNGKKFTEDSNIIFLLSGSAEKHELLYLDKLKEECKKRDISALFMGDRIAYERGKTKNGEKIYSLWDSYVYSDLATYPSIGEMWGNQFLESVYTKIPIVLFEYPVFKSDIKSEGYQYISLGDKIDGYRENGLVRLSKKKIKRAVNQAIKVLTQKKETNAFLAKNCKIGEKNHGEKVMRKLLAEILNGQ